MNTFVVISFVQYIDYVYISYSFLIQEVVLYALYFEMFRDMYVYQVDQSSQDDQGVKGICTLLHPR